jgi:hypothetical protein
MSDTKVKKSGKPKRRRPRQSSFHFTVWTMNGEPFPEEVVEALEANFTAIAEFSKVRLLSDVRKF